MWFPIDFNSHVPVYKQIMERIKLLIAEGKLKEGDFIPSIRSLASTLGVNVNTVARAYRELSMQGIIEPVRGEGYRVGSLDRSHMKREMFSELEAVLEKLKTLGVSRSEVIEVVDEIFGGDGNGSQS